MVTAICFGGNWLDTDEDTRVTLEKTNNIIEQGEPKMLHTLDLSVPATTFNCDVMGYGENPHGGGFRNKTGGIVSIDGYIIKGTIGLVSYESERFNLLFTFGAMNTEGFQDTISSLMWTTHRNDTLSFDGKDNTIPNTTMTWGWVNYGNGTHPSGSMGTNSNPLLMPVANLGYILHECAAAIGYTIEVDGVEISQMSATDPISPYFYMFTLPSIKDIPAEYNIELSNYTPRFDGTPVPTVTVTGDGNTLQDAGLEWAVSAPFPVYYCGIFGWISRMCRALRPTRDVTLGFPMRSSVAVAFASGYDFKGCVDDNGAPSWRAFTVDMEGSRQSFVFADIFYWGSMPFNRPRWRIGVYDNEVFSANNPYTFNVYHDSDMVSSGGSMALWNNLPDMTFVELMDTYCKLVVAGYEVDEANGVIRATTFDGMIAAASTNGAMFNENNTKILEKGRILRCVEGWARHNIVHSANKNNHLWEMWRRDYEVTNDMLEEERNMGEIPFYSGWCQDYGDYEFHCEDITSDDNGDLQYEGNVYLMCADPNNGVPLHLNYINRELNVGGNFSVFTKDADQLDVSVLMPFTDFVNLNMESTAALFGRSWLIRSATWSDGVADLKLLSVNFNQMV